MGEREGGDGEGRVKRVRTREGTDPTSRLS